MKKFFDLHNSRNRMILLCCVDILTMIVHPFLSLIFRYEFKYAWVPLEYIHSIKSYMVINIVTTLVIFLLLNLYNSVWTFAGLRELTLIGTACFLSTICQAFGMQILVLPVPRSYHIFYFFLLLCTTVLTRFSYRIFWVLKSGLRKPEGHVYHTLVIGAGEAGSMIIQELKYSAHLNSKVVGVIDDNPHKKGKLIHGVRIIGGRECILDAAKKYDVDEIILAIPSASPKVTRDILKICNQTTCKLKILPGMYQLITEDVSVSKLRDVSIEDLLGRDPIKVDLESVRGFIEGKCIMVTGGGGSIGSELCRQIAKYKPSRLIIFDIYENNAYDIQQELKLNHPELNLTVLIGSVRNTSRIESVMKTYRPDVVYHAAAHKHVPLMEDSPCEAIKNNVIGTYKTAFAAMTHGCKRFVLISTDKAVNPTNIMGASKRLCEMVIQAFDAKIKAGKADEIPQLFTHLTQDKYVNVQVQEALKTTKTEFVAVRFGNVLGSNGSVIPLFRKQIEAGGPVTVTHPDIIRYFMTIPEAVGLVLEAGTYANGGQIFVLDMGEPVKILDMAKNMIKLSGYTPDVEIEFTGLRPGEKLYEEKLMDEEGIQKTDNDLIHVGCPIPFNVDTFFGQLRELMDASYKNAGDIRDLVKTVVTTYRPENH